MVKLKIRTYADRFPSFPIWKTLDFEKGIVEKIIDFDGTYSKPFITHHHKDGGSTSSIPIFEFNDWSVIEQVNDDGTPFVKAFEEGYYWVKIHSYSDWTISYWDGEYYFSGGEDSLGVSVFKVNENRLIPPNEN